MKSLRKYKLLLGALLDPGKDMFDYPAWPLIALAAVLMVFFILGSIIALIANLT